MSLLDIDKLEPISADWLKSHIIKYLKLCGYMNHNCDNKMVIWWDTCDWDYIRTNPDQSNIYIYITMDYISILFYVGSSPPKSAVRKFTPLYKHSDGKLLSITDII